MNNFTYSIPTKIHFGKGQISHLSELSESGNKVLLCYGGGSIKKAGIYDEAVKILKEEDMEIFELSGIAPNPKIESVREGVKLCKENNITAVLGIVQLITHLGLSTLIFLSDLQLSSAPAAIETVEAFTVILVTSDLALIK